MFDSSKFFDRVNHDRLMARIAQRVSDKRMLKLIRAFLEAGVMEGGLVSPVDEGTPQGGPLSPLLSNIVLDELDQELELSLALVAWAAILPLKRQGALMARGGSPNRPLCILRCPMLTSPRSGFRD